jgi:hypothetical protein
MAKATYHNEVLEGKPLDILGKNKDGTLNLGIEKDSVVLVRCVPVSDVPKIGHAILGDKPSKPEPVKTETAEK